MTRRIVPPTHSQKDANGIYLRPEPPNHTVSPDVDSVSTDVSIDALMNKGLLALERAVKSILTEISTMGPTRENIQNLKDCLGMLHELKKQEDKELSKLTDSELEAFITE